MTLSSPEEAILDRPRADTRGWTAAMIRPLADQGVGTPASFVARDFDLAAVRGDESLRISALGHYRAFINGRRVGDECAQSLAPVDDAVALELLVGALHGDDADEQLLGQPPERGERRAGLETPFADLTLQAVDDLQVQRPARRYRERGDQEPRSGSLWRHRYCIYRTYTVCQVRPCLLTKSSDDRLV